jgi:hypothetical protein
LWGQSLFAGFLYRGLRELVVGKREKQKKLRVKFEFLVKILVKKFKLTFLIVKL